MNIIGHRGACGYLPEHTLESYQLAIEQGTDAVETDVVMTRDGQLICRHDCELSLTTDVADYSEFSGRYTSKLIDGDRFSGWFVEDFTLEEIRTLRARQRFNFRSQAFNDRLQIPTLEELVDFVSRRKTTAHELPSLMIELKHPTYFESINLDMGVTLEKFLSDSSNIKKIPTFIECFEPTILRRLRRRLHQPIIQLIDDVDLRPSDRASAEGHVTFGEMITPAGIADIATYAVGIGVLKTLVIPATTAEQLINPGHVEPLARSSLLVDSAHAHGLVVHAWTFRDETRFLDARYGNDPAREYQTFARLGVDGAITDFPDTAVTALR